MEPFFFRMLADRLYKDVLTCGVSINKSLLFRYFDPIFIHILVESDKGFYRTSNNNQVIHQNSLGEVIT